MPFVKGNAIGQDSRFKTGQSVNPAGRPPDKLRGFIYAELDKIEREAEASPPHGSGSQENQNFVWCAQQNA